MTVTQPELRFSLLSLDDCDDILGLLRDTWPVLYGDTGCIDFDGDYLRWLYGGPDADRHLLLGCFKGDRLVGVKAALYRRLTVSGALRDGQLASHLAIANDLSLGERMTAASELSRPHSLTGFEGWEGFAADTLSIAYFETDKPLARNTERSATKAGYSVTTLPFRQAIVNPRKLAAQLDSMDAPDLRPMRHEDVPDVLELMSRSNADIRWSPSPEAFWHHTAMAPSGSATVAIRQGAITGMIASYPLNWLRDGQTTHSRIVETLAYETRADLLYLLNSTLEIARDTGSRGVVLENATYIDAETRKACAILLTPREMVMMIRAHTPLGAQPTSFAIDLK